MDSAYLKNHVGTVLAKGIAETVTAQPGNPQEYLALYLLHQIQEEERRVEAATRRKKANELREDWSQQHALKEKAAVDVIQRGFHRFQNRLKAKHAAEEELRNRYAEAEAEVEELLEQEAALKENNGMHNNANDEDDNTQKDRAAAQLAAQESALSEARAEFFKSQRFLLGLSKTAIGGLKQELADMAERVRMAQDVTLGAYHRAAAQESALVEVAAVSLGDHQQLHPQQQHAQQQQQAPPHLSAAAAELAARMEAHRDHRFVSVPYINYLVLRCLFYLLFSATPKATSTAAKVAALVKPTVMVQQLRSFNPVAGYDRGVPLRLEKIVPELAAALAGDQNGDDEDDGAAARRAAEEERNPNNGISVPCRQPPTRQVRRAARVLRLCWMDGEYQCEVNPEEFYSEEMVEEDTAKAAAAAARKDEEEEERLGFGSNEGDNDDHPQAPLIPTLAREIEEAAAARGRVAEVHGMISEQVKQRGGIVLYGLLRFTTAAVAYRQARDGVAKRRQEMGLPVDANEEMPEEEEEDPLNDEALMDAETGELDHVATLALQERIGVDTEEALAKIWETRDTRQREAYAMKAAALQRQMDAGGEEDDEDAADAE